MSKFKTGYIVSVIITAVLAALIIAAIWGFTSQSGRQSNDESRKLAFYVQKVVAPYLSEDPGDKFWSIEFNALLRKVAHFLEYMLLGISVCSFFNMLFRRWWLALLLSAMLCPGIAVFDEYRQRFVTGRSPRWLDVRIDTAGAVLGILLTSVVFALIWTIIKLKKRIRELESRAPGKLSESVRTGL